MAAKTQYYDLSKPSLEEIADIEQINVNMDKIDLQMRRNEDGVNFAKSISSDAYDHTRTYAVGDYCIYDNKLYRCITAIESAEEFNVEKWGQTTVGNEVKQLNSNLYDLKYSEFAGGKNHATVSNFTNSASYKPVIPCKLQVNTEYTVSCTFSKSTTLRLINTDGTYQYVDMSASSVTFTTEKEVKEVAFYSTVTISNLQIEEGTTATDYEPYIPSVKMLADEVNQQNESLSVIGKCKNLLNLSLPNGVKSYTHNEVTFTDNGDGTFTVNGTPSKSEGSYVIFGCSFEGVYKLLGTPVDNSNCLMQAYFNGIGWGNSYLDGRIINSKITNISIKINQGFTCDNLLFKPMLTTNLNATYDDFVPYTGDGDTLTADVNTIKNDLGGLSFSVSGTNLTITDGTNTWTLSN